VRFTLRFVWWCFDRASFQCGAKWHTFLARSLKEIQSASNRGEREALAEGVRFSLSPQDQNLYSYAESSRDKETRIGTGEKDAQNNGLANQRARNRSRE
jgi:hypothetical protein